MARKKKEEVIDSQKMSERDKREAAEGACVNCAVAVLLIVVVTVLSFVI
ncbi:MAG: hypothetical protein QXS20_05520 [Candidatus Thorarchaeota archaeon]